MQKVDGLGQKLCLKQEDQAGIRLPEDVRVNDLVLRRALKKLSMRKSPHGVKEYIQFKYGAKNKASAT